MRAFPSPCSSCSTSELPIQAWAKLGLVFAHYTFKNWERWKWKRICRESLSTVVCKSCWEMLKRAKLGGYVQTRNLKMWSGWWRKMTSFSEGKKCSSFYMCKRSGLPKSKEIGSIEICGLFFPCIFLIMAHISFLALPWAKKDKTAKAIARFSHM